MFTKEELVEIQQCLRRELEWITPFSAPEGLIAKLEAIEDKTLALIADMNKAEAKLHDAHQLEGVHEFPHDAHPWVKPTTRREDPEQS